MHNKHSSSNEITAGTSLWRARVEAARQLETSDLHSSRELYLSALQDCRKQLGPNSAELAELLDAAQRVCAQLGLNLEAESYKRMSSQIRVFNQSYARPYSIQCNVLF